MKLFTFALLLLISMNIKAQVFVGMQMNTIGCGLHGGYQLPVSATDKSTSANSVLFNAGVNTSLKKSYVPRVIYATVGYLTSISKTKALTLSFSAGPSYQTYEDFAAYDESHDWKISRVKKFAMFYTSEFAKDMHIGRLFVNVSYAYKMVYGVGVRAFIQ